MWFSWWPTLFFLFCITTKIRKWSQVEILPSMQDQDQPELVSLGDTEKTRNIRDRRCIVPRKSLTFLYSSFGVGASSTYLDVSPTLLHIDASLFCWKECLHVHGRDVVRSLKCFLWSHLLTTEAQTPSQHARYNNKEVLVAFLVAAWHGVVTDRDRCAAFFYYEVNCQIYFVILILMVLHVYVLPCTVVETQYPLVFAMGGAEAALKTIIKLKAWGICHCYHDRDRLVIVSWWSLNRIRLGSQAESVRILPSLEG